MRIFIFILLVLILSCKGKREKKEIIPQEVLTQLLEGDLILRAGTDVVSEGIKMMNEKDKSFSHAGIVIKDKDGKTKIAHSISLGNGKKSLISEDLIEQFLNPEENSGFMILRYDEIVDYKGQISEEVRKMRLEGIEFDHKMDFKSDEKMYCTEFIYKVFKRVNKNFEGILLKNYEGEDYLPLENLYLNAKCNIIYKNQF